MTAATAKVVNGAPPRGGYSAADLKHIACTDKKLRHRATVLAVLGILDDDGEGGAIELPDVDLIRRGSCRDRCGKGAAGYWRDAFDRFFSSIACKNQIPRRSDTATERPRARR